MPLIARMASGSSFTWSMRSPKVSNPADCTSTCKCSLSSATSKMLSSKARGSMVSRSLRISAWRASSSTLRSASPRFSMRSTKRAIRVLSSRFRTLPSSFCCNKASTFAIVSASSAASFARLGSLRRSSKALPAASETLMMSIRQPVSLAASRAFCPSRPIARLS